MQEPFPDCIRCKHLLQRIDSLKHSIRTLEETLARKRLSLELFINNGLMRKLIHHQIRLIEYDQTTINLIIKNLADCYTEYGNHLMRMKKMKIETEIILPYEDLPESNNESIKSLKIIQNTIKYYGSLIREIQITLKDLKRKISELAEPPLTNYSTFEQGKGFSKEEIQNFFRKN